MATNQQKASSMGPTTAMVQAPGSKRIKVELLNSMGQATDLGKAPPSRVYTNDYSKKQEPKDRDMVGPYLGNPLRW